MRDELIEIDSRALRFDIEEAFSFLNDVGGLRLSRGDAEALTTSTEGWAAALRLAALSLRGGRDVNSLLGRLSGASDVVGDFLAENVFDTLEPDVREFLLDDIDHRAHLRRAGLRAGGCDERAGDVGSRSSSAVCSCSGSTTTRIGFATITYSPSFCAADSNVDHPDRVEELHHSRIGVVRRTRLPQRGRRPCVGRGRC